MPTTDKRQLIINKVKTAVALILTASGYYTNIGQKVTEGKVNPYGDNRVDGIDVIDPEDESVDVTESEELEDHTVKIEIKTIAKNPLTPEVARKQIADVRKAMLTLLSDSWWKENVSRLSHVRNSFEIEQSAKKIIGATIIFEVDFDTLKLQES